MLNPYIIIALLVGAIALSVGGYRYGKHVCQGEQATVVADAQKQAITDANAATAAAVARTLAQAKAEAAQRLAATTIRLKGERDAALKARPECVRDADSMGLLLESIAAANGQAPTLDGVPDSVPATPGPSVGK